MRWTRPSGLNLNVWANSVAEVFARREVWKPSFLAIHSCLRRVDRRVVLRTACQLLKRSCVRNVSKLTTGSFHLRFDQLDLSARRYEKRLARKGDGALCLCFGRRARRKIRQSRFPQEYLAALMPSCGSNRGLRQIPCKCCA